MPLTDIECRNAKPRDRDYKLSDGDGLYLRVRPGGTKAWRMKYRFGGKEKVLAFGAYPAVPLATARTLCAAARDSLSLGVDPAGQTTPDTIPTFEQVARQWHEGRKDTLDPAHEQRVLSRLERDVFPEIGSRPIARIEPPEILEMVRKVEARGALDIARRMKQGCSQVFRYAIAHGWAKRDPSADLKGALKPKPRVKHMARIRGGELPEFMRRLSQYDGDRTTALALRFTMLTWVRTKETRFGAWSEIEDLGGREPLWRIPEERMKQRREHLVPLSTQAVAVLREMRRLGAGSPWLFPGAAEGGVLSQNTMIFAMYRMGYHGRATVHGMRGLASTMANESGLWHADAVELQLAHDDDDEVRAAYNSAQRLVERRRMLQWFGDVIDGAVADPLAAVLG